MRALAAAQEVLYQRARAGEGDVRLADPAGDPPTFVQQQADALALLAETALHHELDPGTPGERYQVVVHVDASGAGASDQPGQSVLEDGAHVSAETSRRLACDASRVVMRHDEDGRLLEDPEPGRERFPPPCAARSTIATAPAASRAAAAASPRDTTSATGRRAVPRRSRTSRFSVDGTTARCTRRATRSRASPTAGFGSSDWRVRFCPRRRRRPQCRMIPSRLSALQNDAQGLHLDARTACPGWLGERLNVVYAIDFLHPLAQQSRPCPAV